MNDIASRLTTDNQVRKTHIGNPFDCGFVENELLIDAIQQGVPENPNALELLGLLVLDSLSMAKTGYSYLDYIRNPYNEPRTAANEPEAIQYAMGEIEKRIEREQYDTAFEEINALHALTGGFPKLDAARAEVEMIIFLSDHD